MYRVLEQNLGVNFSFLFFGFFLLGVLVFLGILGLILAGLFLFLGLPVYF